MFGDNRDTIFKTEYRDGAGAEALTTYMAKGEQVVRDRTGRPLSDEGLERFNDRAEGQRTRHIILSPANHTTISDAEADRATRAYASELVEDRPTADYVYAVHDDKEGRDVHIAMTSSDPRDLELYPKDIARERERAHECYLEHGPEPEREQAPAPAQAPEREPDRGPWEVGR